MTSMLQVQQCSKAYVNSVCISLCMWGAGGKSKTETLCIETHTHTNTHSLFMFLRQHGCLRDPEIRTNLLCYQVNQKAYQ